MNQATRPRQAGGAVRSGVTGRMSSLRAGVRSVPGGALAWRVGITLIGLAVIAVGIVLLPLPGPGWLIIFAGLGVLATEYEWASRLLRTARRLLAEWTHWAAEQGCWVQAAVGLLGLVILAGAILGSWYLYKLV